MIFLVVRIITIMLGVIVAYWLLCYFINQTKSEHVLIKAHQIFLLKMVLSYRMGMLVPQGILIRQEYKVGRLV